MCAVFHDRFPDFIDEVREHLGQLPAQVSENCISLKHVQCRVYIIVEFVQLFSNELEQ